MSKRIVLLQALASTPRDLSLLLNGLDAPAGWQRPDPERWSIADVASHLIYVEKLYRTRLRRVVEEDRPQLPTIHPDDSAHDREIPLPELLARFRQERDETLTYLKGLKMGQWQRPAIHETWGDTKLRFLVQALVDHDIQHLGQIAEIQQRLRVKPDRDPQPAIPRE